MPLDVDWVRPATGGDAIAGRTPRYVASPPSTEDAARLMRAAAAQRLQIVPRGTGSKLDWGGPPVGVDLVIDCTSMDRVLEYAPGDLVMRVQAGIALSALQKTCADSGQMLALDPPTPDGTVGGAIATNVSGPYRMRYGTCRDLLIGITVVRADGTVARSGGKVVKNVAGYDLGKLYTGSYGTLGLITEAVFRLHPRPPARAVVSLRASTAQEATTAAERIRRSQVAVSALEMDRPECDGPLEVAALVEGADDVSARAGQVADLFGSAATVAGHTPPWWGAAPWPADGTAIKISVRLSRLAAVLGLLQRSGVAVRGSLGAGVLYAGLPREAESGAAELLTALRAELPPGDGSAVVLRTEAVDRLDLWGPVGGLALMRRVKERFDPHRLLAPGRFVGGI